LDAYAKLGVPITASTAEIRRAYRELALRHHPDRAGPGGTARFREIVEAYGVLSNPEARAAYDTRQHRAGQGGEAARARRPSLGRISGRLEALIGAGLVRRAADGVYEIDLTAAEAVRGGVVALVVPLVVFCSMCGGVARPNGIWCRRCEFAGTVREEIAVEIPIPPAVVTEVPWVFVVNAEHVPGLLEPLRVRFRAMPR
jgi:DnaJ-class molecular chaperone